MNQVGAGLVVIGLGAVVITVNAKDGTGRTRGTAAAKRAFWRFVGWIVVLFGVAVALEGQLRS